MTEPEPAPATAETATDTSTAGLTSAEVADRVGRGLVNVVPSAPTRTVRQIVRANVFTPINLIVLILASLVIVAGSPKDALFGLVIVANSVIGIFQEVRAKQALDKLRVVNAPKVHAIRDGKSVELRTEELVQDDVVELRAGAQIVADGEVLSHDNLEVDESLLTGEADPIVKADGDAVLSGSAVVAGTGRVRITKVGGDNYAAQLAEEARRFTLVNSPLRNDVNRIVTWVGWAIIPVGLLLASSQFWRRHQSWQDAIDPDRRRPGRHGARGPDPADQRRLRRRRRAPRQAALPRPGAAGDRGARTRRRAVRRQDRHDHRRRPRPRRRAGARRNRPGRGGERARRRWPSTTPTRTRP